MRTVIIVTIPLIMSIVLALTLGYSQDKVYQSMEEKSGFIPKEGFVPTADVAQTIAITVLIPVYGNEQIKSERPFKVTLKGDVWTVTGSIPCVSPPPGAACPGGAAEVRISKQTGQILYMHHAM